MVILAPRPAIYRARSVDSIPPWKGYTMSDYSIATLAENKPVFKSKALAHATDIIYEAVAKFNENAKETRRTVAVTLAKVEKHEDYKQDGFKSLAEYAAAIGFEKSAAHKLENAGRLILSENETVKALADEMDVSKLSIIASADEKDIEDAVKTGTLKSDMSQNEVREWKASVNASKPTKEAKAKTYELDIDVFRKNGMTNYHYDSIPMSEVEPLAGAIWGKVKTENGTFVEIAILPDDSLARINEKVEVKPVKAVKGKGKATDKLSKKDLEAVIANLQKQLADLTANKDGSDEVEDE